MVQLTPDGFVFEGEPVTPARHWQTLIAGLSPQEVKEAKTLIR